MRGFLSLLRHFQSDERGAFLVLFGVLAIVLVATSGAVVDYTAIEQARTRGQVALDTAALGLQPTIYDTTATQATLKTESENLLVQQLNTSGGEGWAICDAMAIPPCVRVDNVTIDESEGTLHLEAMLKIPTSFVSLIGFPSIQAKLVSEATRKKLNLEVAMVLDNSGSMAWYSRMTKLKAAATCAINVLFNGDCANNSTLSTSTDVSIGIVPFTEFVNVGTANKTASWMDQTGQSSIANDNFDDDDYDGTPYTGAVDRLSLYANLENTSWKGCVEARVSPYDTDDTVPSSGSPDTLFAPAFAPDEPDSGFYNSYIEDEPSTCPQAPKWVWTQVKKKCNKKATNDSSYNSATCTGTTTNTYVQTSETGAITNPSTQPTSLYNNPATCTNKYKSSGSGSNRTNTLTRTCNYYFSNRELQERLCKYNGAYASASWGGGPNADCPDNALLPLSNVKATVKAKIGAMVADGGTNIHQGAIWGFHMLSPTEPLTQGDAYDTATSKVMIIMTDGENTHNYANNMNGGYWYLPYGYPYNGRLTGASTAALQLEMDVRTKRACANAKAVGITIYTIGLGTSLTSDPAKVQQMLKDCSSGDGYWYFPSDSDDLSDVFEEIAGQLANLRLAQ